LIIKRRECEEVLEGLGLCVSEEFDAFRFADVNLLRSKLDDKNISF
jgi:hypothetical protein